MVTETHPNIAALQKLDLRNLSECAHLFAPDFVWHYFNPNLPDLEGDYVGLDRLQDFFKALASKSAGTFDVHPVSIRTAGEEMVVVHTNNTMTLTDKSFTVDAVVVWRFKDGLLQEAWDIPAAYPLVDDG